MATDAVTELRRPSRFFDDELSNFASPPSPPLPSPFLLLRPNPDPNPSSPPAPDLLLVAVSPPSLFLLRRASPAPSLAGTLVLPETPLPGSSLDSPFPSFHFYTLGASGDSSSSTLAAAVQLSVPSSRAHSVAKCMIRGLRPKKVVIFDSIQRGNFRGRLPSEESAAVAFKMETSQQRGCPDGSPVPDLDNFPSGSVADGLGAALLARCQVEGVKGSLCVTWSDSHKSVVLLKSLLERIASGTEFGSDLASYRPPDAQVGTAFLQTMPKKRKRIGKKLLQNKKTTEMKQKGVLLCRCSPRHFKNFMDSLCLQQGHKDALMRSPFYRLIMDRPNLLVENTLLHGILSTWNESESGFRLGDRLVYFSAVDVSLALGLSLEGDEVRLGRPGALPPLHKRYFKTNFVSRSAIEQVLREIVGQVDSQSLEDTPKLLVLYLFCTVLFSQGNYTVPISLLYNVEEFEALNGYAWGCAVHSTLMRSIPKAAKFVEKINKGEKLTAGYLKGCGAALIVWFFEHTKLCKPAKPLALPRIFKWGVKSYQRCQTRTKLVASLKSHMVICEVKPTTEELQLLSPSTTDGHKSGETLPPVGLEASACLLLLPCIRERSISGQCAWINLE